MGHTETSGFYSQMQPCCDCGMTGLMDRVQCTIVHFGPHTELGTQCFWENN